MFSGLLAIPVTVFQPVLFVMPVYCEVLPDQTMISRSPATTPAGIPGDSVVVLDDDATVPAERNVTATTAAPPGCALTLPSSSPADPPDARRAAPPAPLHRRRAG